MGDLSEGELVALIKAAQENASVELLSLAGTGEKMGQEKVFPELLKLIRQGKLKGLNLGETDLDEPSWREVLRAAEDSRMLRYMYVPEDKFKTMYEGAALKADFQDMLCYNRMLTPADPYLDPYIVSYMSNGRNCTKHLVSIGREEMSLAERPTLTKVLWYHRCAFTCTCHVLQPDSCESGAVTVHSAIFSVTF